MKHNSLMAAAFIAIIVFSFTGIASAQDSAGQFKVIVKLNGLPKGAQAWLLTIKEAELYKPKAGFLDTVAVAVSRSGNFEFKGTLKGNGQRFAIAAEDKGGYVQLMIADNDKVMVSGNMAEWPVVKINGSAGTSQMIAYKKFLTATVKTNASEKEINERLVKYIDTHKDDLYTPFALLQYENMSPAEKRVVYDNLTEISKGSFYGVVLDEAFRKNRLQVPVKEGNLIRDFRLTMRGSGDTVSIIQIAAKNKLTLIDCWSNACKACIAEFPFLKEVYAQYHSKGFEILGITNDPEALLNRAGNRFGLPWLQSVDNLDKVFIGIFRFSSVPGYLLIDQEGKLIAFMADKAGCGPSFGPSIFGHGLINTLDKYLK